MACEEGTFRQDPESGLRQECIGGQWVFMPSRAVVGGPPPWVQFVIPDLDALRHVLERPDVQRALADPLKKLLVTITDDDSPNSPASGRERPPAP